MTRFLIGLVLLFTSACAAPANSTPNEDLALLEACCRWYIADQQARGNTTSAVFVPEELLECLQTFGPRIRPASQAVDDPRQGVVDRETGEHGAILSARAVQKLPDGRAEVHFEAYGGPEGREGATLTLARDGAGWRVQDARDRWIS